MVTKHATSTQWFFVPITGLGTPTIARGQFKLPDTDPVDVDYVTIDIITDVDPLWQLALDTFADDPAFVAPDYFIGALDGPYDIAAGNSVDPEFETAAGSFEFWYELTIGTARPVDRAPDLYTVEDFV